MNRESTQAERAVAPDDLERPAPAPVPVPETKVPARGEDDALEPLFTPDAARNFRASWDALQIGFVDDPRQAVRQADDLVRQVLEDLSRSFSNERSTLDGGTDTAEQPSTENLRLALRRYRSFFQRLLSL
ncbi:hypothetical protein [Variovorax sp. AFSI2.2]|uniref:hypothetical protein n=1 Tax=Variovorax sp. AFSI2.2 TaxID=3384160 RepID=UPI003EBB1FB5